MTTRHIKLMAEYYMPPLWDMTRTGHIDPQSLLLRPQTVQELNAWNLEYTQRLQRFDYYQAGQPSAAEEEAFEHEGVRLWRQLRAELGPTYVVHYAPVFTQLYRPNRPHRLYAHPDEYEAEGES